MPLNLALRKRTEMKMVKRGVAARTTWWNCGVKGERDEPKKVSFGRGRGTDGHSDELEREI